MIDLLGQRSQQNSWLKHLFALYLYATGTQRQTIAVLSSWGLCSSYSTLAGTSTKPSSDKTESQKETTLEPAPTGDSTSTPPLLEPTSSPPMIDSESDSIVLAEDESGGSDSDAMSISSASSDSSCDVDRSTDNNRHGTLARSGSLGLPKDDDSITSSLDGSDDELGPGVEVLELGLDNAEDNAYEFDNSGDNWSRNAPEDKTLYRPLDRTETNASTSNVLHCVDRDGTFRTSLHAGIASSQLISHASIGEKDLPMDVVEEEEHEEQLAHADGVESADTNKQTCAHTSSRTAATAPHSSLSSTSHDHNIGLIRRLSNVCCAAAQTAAQESDVAHVYDNINTVFKAAEQIIGCKDSVENGTCATAIRLYEAPREDMKTFDLLRSLQNAQELHVEDILSTGDEAAEYKSLLTHTIMRIIVTHGGEPFAKYKDDLSRTLPVSEEQIPLHKTTYFPLPAMEIDESSTVGNADVIDVISESLAYDMQSAEYQETVKIYSGDQLSMARLRTVAQNRVGQDAPHRALLNVVQVPGFFHYQMHVTSGCLEAHWGLAGAGAHDPGSLSSHNTVIDRKPIVLTSPPPYRTCRDLIYVSLYARMLHCLEIVSGSKIEDYSSTATFDDLKRHAGEILERFANGDVVDELRDGTVQNYKVILPSIS